VGVFALSSIAMEGTGALQADGLCVHPHSGDRQWLCQLDTETLLTTRMPLPAAFIAARMQDTRGARRSCHTVAFWPDHPHLRMQYPEFSCPELHTQAFASPSVPHLMLPHTDPPATNNMKHAANLCKPCWVAACKWLKLSPGDSHHVCWLY
jgi:hypothetical protein